MSKIYVEIGDTAKHPKQNTDLLVTKDGFSDGYHTFDELYEHRNRLFIALCKMITRHGDNTKFIGDEFPDICKSKLHYDGSCYPGQFIIMINGNFPGKQISYHLPDRYWVITDFIPEVRMAPEWDGHTSEDVLNRLFRLLV